MPMAKARICIVIITLLVTITGTTQANLIDFLVLSIAETDKRQTEMALSHPEYFKEGLY